MKDLYCIFQNTGNRSIRKRQTIKKEKKKDQALNRPKRGYINSQ